MKEQYWLSPNGKRVYKVQQMLNDRLSYRIITVPVSDRVDRFSNNYSAQKRWPDFNDSLTAQAALDDYAKANNLKPFHPYAWLRGENK